MLSADTIAEAVRRLRLVATSTEVELSYRLIVGDVITMLDPPKPAPSPALEAYIAMHDTPGPTMAELRQARLSYHAWFTNRKAMLRAAWEAVVVEFGSETAASAAFKATKPT